MLNLSRFRILAGTGLLLALVTCTDNGSAPPAAADPVHYTFSSGDWPQYRGDETGKGYTALTQVNPANVATLVPGWQYSLQAASTGDTPPRNPNSQVTPIVINNVMYFTAADRVVALDPASGLELWVHRVTAGSPSRRGVSYWPGDADYSPRLYFTAGTRLVALDANSGALVSSFGQNGEIDMVTPFISVPLVYDNVIVIGANTPAGASGGIGNARAFDVHTGAKLWEFNSVPLPGETGHDTWAADSWEGRLGANAWPFYFTVDAARDLLYIPLAGSLPFAYGGDRVGSNLFANSIVAVNIHSGEYVWHFQTIHHDLWDHDPPAPPTLFDINQNGSTVPALAVTTKSGYLFVLNRETGEPVVPVTERAVPQSEVPGEQTWPTQPFPATPSISRVSYADADLVTASDTSAEHATACQNLLSSIGPFVNLGPYTPWSYKPAADAGSATLLFPGLGGGPNWGGAPYDPDTGYVFVFAGDTGTFGWLQDAPAGSPVPYELSGPRPGGFDVRINGMSMPCQKPPWGTLTAVNTVTGEIAWRQTLGVTETLPPAQQNTGRPGRAGALVTASDLLFIGATDDNRFRALQASTGEVLWEATLNARGNANPMSYLGSDGRQYVVISATDTLQSFRLP